MTHKFGPNGHIVDAFITHIKGMTDDQWEPVIAAWNAAWDPAAAAARYAAYDAAGYAARDAARYAAGVAAWDVAVYAAGYAAGHAASDIQGADLMRERGQPFFFLPLFGFADEKAIIQPATQAMDALIAETGDMTTSVYDLAHSKGVPAAVTETPCGGGMIETRQLCPDAIEAADAIEALRSEVTDLQNTIARLTRELGSARDAGTADAVNVEAAK